MDELEIGHTTTLADDQSPEPLYLGTLILGGPSAEIDNVPFGLSRNYVIWL